MIDRIPLLPPEIPNPEITGYKYGTHVTFMYHEKTVHQITSPGILLRASDKSVCSNVGEKIAIKRGFFLRQQMKSSLLTLPSPSLSNNLNKLSIYKQTV